MSVWDLLFRHRWKLALYFPLRYCLDYRNFSNQKQAFSGDSFCSYFLFCMKYWKNSKLPPGVSESSFLHIYLGVLSWANQKFPVLFHHLWVISVALASHQNLVSVCSLDLVLDGSRAWFFDLMWPTWWLEDGEWLGLWVTVMAAMPSRILHWFPFQVFFQATVMMSGADKKK